jgi:hypothetical protein
MVMSPMVLGMAGALTLSAARAQEPPLLLADTTRWPHVTVTWETDDGKGVKLEGERGYKSPGDKTPLGKNIECYVALGGTRLDKGCGDPHGAILRVGLYKADTKQPFFEGIKEGGLITITLDHVYMNQPVEARPRTGLMHERYMLSDLTACGLDGNARNLIVTADPEDAVKSRVQLESTNLGGLDGGAEHGKVEAKVEEDGSVTMTVSFPYPLLRHVKDPYQRTKPGAFFEPQHFHVEMEVVSAKQ